MKVPGIYSLGLSRRQRRNPEIQGVPRYMTVGECLFSYNILDIKDCLQFISLKNIFLEYILLLNQFYFSMTAMLYFLFYFVSNYEDI